MYQEAAQKVYNKISKEQQIVLDPLTMMMLASVLSAVFQAIRLYCEYKRNKAAEAGKEICGHCARRSVFARVMIWRVMRRSMSPAEFKQNGPVLMEAILRAGAEENSDYVGQLLFAE